MADFRFSPEGACQLHFKTFQNQTLWTLTKESFKIDLFHLCYTNHMVDTYWYLTCILFPPLLPVVLSSQQFNALKLLGKYDLALQSTEHSRALQKAQLHFLHCLLKHSWFSVCSAITRKGSAELNSALKSRRTKRSGSLAAAVKPISPPTPTMRRLLPLLMMAI